MPDDDEKVDVKTTQPRIQLDRACFITSGGRDVALCYITPGDDMKEKIKVGGYYGSVRAALQGYVDKVLKGQPIRTSAQLLDLFKQLDQRIEKAVLSFAPHIGHKALVPPAIQPAIEEAFHRKRSRKGTPAVDIREKRLTTEQRYEVKNAAVLEFHNKEIVPGLRWSDIPDHLGAVIVEAIAGQKRDPNQPTDYAQPVFDFVEAKVREVLTAPKRAPKSEPTEESNEQP